MTRKTTATVNGKAAFETIHERQPEHQRQHHECPHQYLDEPQPARGHAVVRTEELVGQQQICPRVVVGQQQRDHDPQHRRHRDPRDGVTQMPHPVGARNRREAEPAEVVAGDAKQNVRAAPQLEQLGVRSDDEHDRRGAQRDAGFQRRQPTAARRLRDAFQLPNRHALPIRGQLADRPFQPHRHGDVRQRVAAEVDEAGIGIERGGIDL